VRGYTPLHAAGALLPLALIVIPLSRIAPKIAARLGVRVTGSIGLGLLATGFIVLSSLGTSGSYWHLFAALVLLGTGMGLSGSPATTAVVASLPREKQGVASSINDLSRELGGALGIAVLGSILNSAYRTQIASHTSTLPATVATKARGALGAAQTIGRRLGDHDLITHANTAFVHGIDLAFLAAAGVLLAGAIFVAFRAQGHAESQANTGATAAPRLTPNPERP
jgi:hypothetical protein